MLHLLALNILVCALIAQKASFAIRILLFVFYSLISRTGLSLPSGFCSSGYYCVGKSFTPTPNDNVVGAICPLGSYCPSGSPNYIPCEAGSYSNSTGFSACLSCPAGYQCTYGSITPVPCRNGYYCPERTGASQFPCPAGRYSDSALSYPSYSSFSLCKLCDAGYYCSGSTSNLLNVTGECSAGYYCLEGSINTFGGASVNATLICPPGYYCPARTAVPIYCPVGTFSSASGNIKLSDCINCTAGFYCNNTGLSLPSGPCQAGYFCNSGSSISNPTDTVHGNLCNFGGFCPTGSAFTSPCPAGTYARMF